MLYFHRRLESLEDPTRPPVTVYTQNPNTTLKSFQAEQNPVVPSEQEIRGRLQKLRKRLVAAPSVEEMEERLARLQGMPMKTKAHSIGNQLSLELKSIHQNECLTFQDNAEISQNLS
jgi:hypothetical protein